MNARTTLWTATSTATWRAALDRYDVVVAAQGVTRLAELDSWFRRELPALLRERKPPYVRLDELARLTEWKMARGVWRAPNLVRVKGNPAALVEQTSHDALAKVPHPTAPIAALAALDGVGPATASAVVSAFAPETYPFFDELVAHQVPGLGVVAWTLAYYARYANALRERATALGSDWTPVMIERALWAEVGGKAGVGRIRGA